MVSGSGFRVQGLGMEGTRWERLVAAPMHAFGFRHEK